MTKTEFARILSRAFALYLTVWVISDCGYLPRDVHSLLHYMSQRSVVAVQRDYWADYYLIETATMTLRIVVLATLAIYFWRGGSGVARILLGADAKLQGTDQGTSVD